MPELSKFDLRILMSSVVFVLIITAMGFGIAGIQISEMPTLDTEEINEDFIPTDAPEFGTPEPDTQNTWTGTVPIGGERNAGDWFGTQDLIMRAYENDTHVTATSRVEADGMILQEVPVSFDKNASETVSKESILTPDAGNISTEFTYEPGSDSVQYEVLYGIQNDDGIIANAVNVVGSAIQVVASTIVFLAEVIIFGLQWIIGWAIQIVSAIVIVLGFFVALIAYLFTVFTAIGSIHPILQTILTLPTLAIGYVLGKIVFLVVKSFPTT